MFRIHVLKLDRIFNLSVLLRFLHCLISCTNFLIDRDVNISYIGMTTRHLGIGIQERRHHKTTKSAIRNRIEIRQNCKLNNAHLNDFKVLRICDSENTTNFTHKNDNPQLN